MVDWVVILTPLLVLGVLLLLGYAGCNFDPSGPAGPEYPHFDIVLRARATTVPASSVTEISYTCQQLGQPAVQHDDENPLPSAVEGAETTEPTNVYRHSCGEPAPGPWRVSCSVRLSADGGTLSDGDYGDVVLDEGDEFPEANFRANRTQPDVLDVRFEGYTPGP